MTFENPMAIWTISQRPICRLPLLEHHMPGKIYQNDCVLVGALVPSQSELLPQILPVRPLLVGLCSSCAGLGMCSAHNFDRLSLGQQDRHAYMPAQGASPLTHGTHPWSPNFGSSVTYLSHLIYFVEICGRDANMTSFISQLSIKRLLSLDVNILGTDFCEFHQVSAWQEYAKRRAKMYIGGGQPQALVRVLW